MVDIGYPLHDHGNVILRMVDVMLQSTTITLLSTGQLNQLFAHSFFQQMFHIKFNDP